MRYYTFIVVLLFFIVACGNKKDTTTQSASSDSRKDVQQVLDLYVQSINAADTAIAAKVWEQSNNISLINPVERIKGWDTVKNHFYKELQGFWKSRSLMPKDVAIHVYGDAAWADFLVDFTGTTAADGKEMTFKNMKESHVYHKTADGWRLVHVHYSPQTDSL